MTITTDRIAAPAAREREETATFRSRVGGYVVDMVIFSAIAMVIVVIAGFILLASTGWAEQDASDAEFYTFLALIGLGAPITWTALNLALLAMRGQTGGQYVAGIRLVRDDGSRLSGRAVVAWWFCFNPLLFSWPMAIVAGMPLAAVMAIVLGSLTVFAFGFVITLCVVLPVVAFVSAAVDGDNRALHDRIIGTRVVPVR